MEMTHAASYKSITIIHVRLRGRAMSDRPVDWLELQAQITQIKRNEAEIDKLFAEARRFNRDPWMVLIGVIIAVLALRLPEVLHAFGRL
jgi:hypothetical protein